MSNDIERRVATVALEYRADENGDEAVMPTIKGHAAVFNTPTRIADFREQIAPGAFTRALDEKHDTRALFNHDPNRVLGRTPNTLRMAEDDTGLAVEIDPPLGEAGLLELMERGDVTQMSFGFRVTGETWEETDDLDLRTIDDVDLFDVSVVTFPAYPETDAGVRAHAEFRTTVDMQAESEHNAAPDADDIVPLRRAAWRESAIRLAKYLGGARD